MRVLIADDDIDGAEVLKLMFEDAGCQVVVVHSGLEAIAQTPAFKPHLVVLDISMPGMDGIETAARLSRDPATSKDVVYVAHTSHMRSALLDRLKAAPFSHFVQKPSRFASFEAILRSLATGASDEGEGEGTPR